MKNKIKIITIIVPFLFVSVNYAQDGSKIFNDYGCVECHDYKIDQTSKGLGPSITQIKSAYGKDRSELVNFLNGNAKPRINIKMSPVMIAQLATIKSLPESSKIALANFLMK